ncbi:MAG: dockerin type I repeat-containing protein [Planctomycetota bacterium]
MQAVLRFNSLRDSVYFLAFWAIWAAGPLAFAGPPDFSQGGMGTYEYSITDATAPEGLLYSHGIWMGITNDPTIQGWSFSVCHDSTTSDVCGLETTSFVQALNPIAGLFFESLGFDDRATVIPGSTDGAWQLIVIDQFASFFFPTNGNHEVCVVSYLADPGTAGTVTSTSICNDSGNPQVEAVIVCCGGQSIHDGNMLVTGSATTTHTASSDQWSFRADPLSVLYCLSTGGCIVCNHSIDLEIANTAANTTLTEGAGFAFALTYDSNFITVNGVAPGAGLTALNGGLGPDLFVSNDTGSGISVQVLNTELPMIPGFPYQPELSTWSGQAAVVLDVSVNTTSLAGNLLGATTTLSWGDAGDGVSNSMTIFCGQESLIPLAEIALEDIDILLEPLFALDFSRGDCNGDASMDIADVIFLIGGYLAMPATGPPGLCAAACDINGDEGIDIADVSYGLNYLLLGGSMPPPPFPGCDIVVGVDCQQTTGCP